MAGLKAVKLGLVVLLSAAPVLAAGPSVEAASVKALTMKEAMDQGLKISSVLRDAKTDISKKKLELEQAQHAVKSEEAKASGLFAKPRNLSQDLTTRLKVPEASKQLYLAQETLRQSMNTVRFDVQKAYLTAYQDDAAEENARKKWQDAKTALDTVKKKRKFGLADNSEQEEAEKTLEKATSVYKQAQLTAKSSRLALGKLLQLDMENKVQLSFEPDYANLDQKQLPAYITSGLKSTVSLLKDTEDRRLADHKLSTTRDLYSSKFGSSRMKVMDGLYKAKDIDMDMFLASYETTLSQVKKDWEGFFLLLGFIPIPKSLLQGEFDGLRYLDDLRDALPIATMEQNKAVLQEKESRTAVIAAVRASYMEAKGAEEGYAQALRDKDSAVGALDKAAQKVKLSLMKTDELTAYKEAVSKADEQILMAQMSYEAALGKLDIDTGGAVAKTLKKGILPYQNLDDGLAAVKPQNPKVPAGSWKLKPAVGPLLSDFSVTVNKKIGATDYALFTKDGHAIGKRTKLNKAVRQLTLKLSQLENLKVVLYAKRKPIGELLLEGKGNAGQLAAVEAEATDGEASGAADGAANEGSSTGGEGTANGESGSGADEEKGPGTVIIGSYKVRLDALTPEAYNAASATMSSSGQGIFYKADEPGAVWFGMDNAVDPSAIADPTSSAALSQKDAEALKVTVEIAKPGAIASLQTPEQLQQQIDTLKKDIVKLEAAKEAAVTDMKLSEIADLAVEIKDAQAQLGMLEALQKGDNQAALQQMELVNNPDALIAALSEENETPPGEPGGETPPGGTAPGKDVASEDALAGQAELQQTKLEQALAAGEPKAAAANLQQLLATQAQLADAQTGASAGQASLAEAKLKLEAALKLAQAQGDTERVATLTRSLEAVAEAVATAKKDALFAQLDAVQMLAAALPQEAGVQTQLEQQVTKLLEELQQQEKAKYTPEEQAALADVSASLAASAASASIQPIPAENVLSPNIFIKFDAPPVIINGQAYLPIRSVSESFGAAVDWDQDTLTVTVSTEYRTITSRISEDKAYVDGDPVQIDGPAYLLEGRTYVPLRFIAESLGLQVDWNAPTQIIQISY
ncbi:stalk domain-containing protein [Paenibacillus chondroitinus]|uniref:Stalk domain-containing protein n=1 Tax=Paenibacillus chondroitinus TaxID=59842 RepID=A0ABU6DB52_9BACL|nr:stalk domain-containing protein [Paenibacillus chondroitinus]MCY9657665.1 stalk domain-containing protein [Paenibacillus anseongense]MEB4794959.1 stalk domain-containing protein [Paenibacillus chondroitinus]